MYGATLEHQQAAERLQGAFRNYMVQETWHQPLMNWLEHVARGDVPYVPWLLYVWPLTSLLELQLYCACLVAVVIFVKKISTAVPARAPPLCHLSGRCCYISKELYSQLCQLDSPLFAFARSLWLYL